MFDQDRHDEINDGLIEGEDLEKNLSQIDEVISAEEEEFLKNNQEPELEDPSDLGNNQEVLIH